MKGASTGFEIVPLSEITSLLMFCGEKTRLLAVYDMATLAFSEAVQELRQKIGTSPREEYKRLERISLEARMESEQARLALEQHVATHGC